MLKTISDVGSPLFRTAVQKIWTVAPATDGAAIAPVIPGMENYMPPWVASWHNSQRPPRLHEICCYGLKDAVISGDGQVWIGQNLITAPEIMPLYVNHILKVEEGGVDLLKENRSRPLRSVSGPCLVAAGHGAQVYGHFLIEVLFRLLAAKQAEACGLPRHKILVEKDAPPWFFNILTRHLGIDASDIEVFEPASECIHLQHAIVPTRVLQEPGFHPAAKAMLDAVIDRIPAHEAATSLKRVFISRHRYSNHSAPHRICVNEAKLAEIAQARFGFTPVTIETLEWPEQIRLFRDAEIIVGQAGSGLHNALFSAPGSRLGSIGFMNFVQSQIAAMRGQEIGYLAKDFDLVGEFSVDEDAFIAFMEILCGEKP